MLRHWSLVLPAMIVATSLVPRSARADESSRTCRYENPFSKVPECRAYLGNWTDADAKAACDAVFTGVSGEFGGEACSDDGAIGTCMGPAENGRRIKIWFYGGDLEVTKNMCGDFFKGTWNDGSGQAGPSSGVRPAEQAAVAMMASTEWVEVSPTCSDEACIKELIAAKRGIWFSPRQGAEATIVLYPGAMVDPRAYAPVAHAIAERGVSLVVVPMPDALALNGWERAIDVMGTAEGESRWFLAGHSMGGAMAAHFLHEHSDLNIEGLVLWAAYADEKDDISDRNLAVLSLQGSRDGVSTAQEIETHKPHLPPSTSFLTIVGGNHAQFGAYGSQDGDESAYISEAEQRAQVAGATVHFVNQTLHGVRAPHTSLSSLPPDQGEWCRRLQNVVANLQQPLAEREMSVQTHVDIQAFGASKPGIDNSTASLHARVSQGGNATLLDAPPIVANEVWCKVKTQAAIVDAFGRAAAGQAGRCSDMNQQTLAWALEQLPAGDRDRFDRLGIEVQFLDDIEYTTGVEWLGSDGVQLVARLNNSVAIASPRLLVGDAQDLPEAARNVLYCKLWAPERALLWALELARTADPATAEPEKDGGCSLAPVPSRTSWGGLLLLLGTWAAIRGRQGAGSSRTQSR